MQCPLGGRLGHSHVVLVSGCSQVGYIDIAGPEGAMTTHV